MKKKNYLLTLLLFLAFFSPSCKKDPEPPKNEPKTEEPTVIECVEPDWNCPFGIQYGEAAAFYTLPCFNPNNGNELIYAKKERGTAGALTFYKYHLLTNQNTLIKSNFYPFSPPNWSPSGWIVFASGDKVWKVRDDGTGLQQISFGQHDRDPAFNPAGDKIIYNHTRNYSANQLSQNPALRNNSKMKIIDLNGNLLDSICSLRFGYCYNWGVSSWVASDKILRLTHSNGGPTNEGELSFYNYATGQEEPSLLTFMSALGKDVLSYKAISPTQIFYSQNNVGLMYYDATTNIHRMLKQNCHDAWYGYISISPDKTRLLAEKEINTFNAKCDYSRKKVIVLMNIDGSNEQEVPLP